MNKPLKQDTMKAILTYSPVCGGNSYRTVYLSGVASLQHAEAIGHGLTGAQSIAASLALYLSGVALDNGDFVGLPTPDYFREGVEVSATPFKSATYATLSNSGVHEKDFDNEADAVEWNQGFTDGPDSYPLRKLIGGDWHQWDVATESWKAACK